MNFLERTRSLVNSLFDQNKAANKQLLNDLTSEGKHETELAFAVLLVDMAMIDQEFEPREYEYIFGIFEKHFGLSRDEITSLIKHASSLIGQQRGSHSFALQLQENLDKEERQKMIEMLRGLVQADDKEDGFEVYLMQKFEKILSDPEQ